MATRKGTTRAKYSPEQRREIASEYRRKRAEGQILHVGNWARARWKISLKTLERYCKEFPELSPQPNWS